MPRPKNKVDELYHLSLKIGDKVFEGSGETVLEALKTVETPDKILNKTILKITHGEKVLEKVYIPFQARRLFYPLTQALLAKQLTYLLK